MNENLRNAYQALLEGDRDGVLHHIQNETPTPVLLGCALML